MLDEDEQRAIRMSGIVKQRPNFNLGPIQLDIPEGYITAIVGPNGSGKSSVFHLLLDLMKPDAGTIEVLGRRVGEQPDDVSMKQRIGYLPEGSSEIDNAYKAEEKAAFYKLWYPQWDVNRYQKLLHEFQVNASQRMGKMSKGTRRKFDFIMAIAHNPDLLLLDEPSSGFDPLAWGRMVEILHQFMEQPGKTIVIATHIAEEVRRLADYIVFMIGGRVLGCYEKDELLHQWYAYFVDDGSSGYRWEQMPGFYGKEEAGGGRIKLVTSQASEAEDWLRQAGLRIAGKEQMALEHILAAHVTYGTSTGNLFSGGSKRS